MKGFGTYISPQTAGILKQENPVELYGMETDKDYIHYMIETESSMSVSKILNLMKRRK